MPKLKNYNTDPINMKLVREYINEKFTDVGNDPIKDLGIGHINVHKNFKSYKEGYIFICKYIIPYIIESDDIKSIINPASRTNATIPPIKSDIYFKICNYVIQYLTVQNSEFDLSGHDLNNYIMIKKLRESFSEESDPISDMGIGKIDIHKYIRELRTEDKNFDRVYEFLSSLIGKKITGNFKKGHDTRLEVGSNNYAFMITRYTLVNEEERLQFEDDGFSYLVMWGEKYHIS